MRPLQQYYEFMGVSLHCHNLTIQSQGNVRCVVRHDGTLVESNEYYPHGGLFSATASVQPNKYGSKELDRTNGLDLYDSEARWYDSLLGRTTTMGPLAEKYYSLSPYLWCAGNPVNINDIDGNTITAIIEDNEFFIRKGPDGFYKLFDKYNNIYNPNRNFIEDLYNYECWALWSQKELIYCYNGQINVYSKPSAKLEKLFDNYQEQDISAVLSDRTINIFPNRKNFKSTFFVAKIRIRDSKPDIIYVKRFNGYF